MRILILLTVFCFLTVSATAAPVKDYGTAEEKEDFLAFDREQQKKENELPLGTFTLRATNATATMSLAYNDGGDLVMTVRAVTPNGKCQFMGMCDMLDGGIFECSQAFTNSDKIITLNGRASGNGIELFAEETPTMCSNGGAYGLYKPMK